MPITEDQYKAVKAALNKAGDDAAALSPEFRAKAQAAVDEFEGGLVTKLDPNLPVMAQALATQPATTHPGGDDEAEREWLNNPQGKNGTTIVYEMPLSVAKKDLLENPDKLAALGYSRIPPTPEDIQGMDASSSIYHAYNDQKWRDTADAAAKAGKVAYRYSKAPWLQNGSPLSSLALKLKASVDPAMEQAAAFVMGVDDTAAFGVGRKGLETAASMDRSVAGLAPPAPPSDTEPVVDPTTGMEMGQAPKAAETDSVGGVMGTFRAGNGDPKQLTQMLEEEHPKTYTAGQIAGIAPDLAAGAVKGVGKGVGLASKTVGEGIQTVGRGIESLAPWSASNALYNEVASGGQKVLARLGATEGVPAVLASALAAGGAGVAVHGAQEGVDAAANYAQTGDAGTTAGEAALRSLGAGLLPAALGGAGAAVQKGTKAYGDWVRTGNGSITGGRYQGVPGKLERAGVEPQFGRGYVAPAAVTAAQAEARQLEVPVEQVLAERVAPKVAEGAKALRREGLTRVRPRADGSLEVVKNPDPDLLLKAKIAAPKGDAYAPVKAYASQKSPDVRRTRAVRAAAERAGASQELEQTRVPALLGQLETITSPTYKKVADPTVFGTAMRLADKGNINLAYPALRSLEGPLGPLAAGKAGRVGLVGKDDKVEEAKAQEESPRAARYAAWRAEYLKRKEAPKPRKRRAGSR